ncbi:MAG TPA: zf-HC2 domain-containing protein [Accumulibacter sp.]|uniref:zf-HC2 domain-containing protein n=1 Tax=Accumulibacter sp. TaxID=2053492 RepID=UPI00258BA252|nr:zf-HC2 domain-containing protein [Accumulibacter sp.]MCM8599438.1 zf-HC2 domain-containing protein [Accumulibacter sp.]MCM8622401.1 zf-HC2 domain-containing protein [Accumulibacter sp.]MCM8663563.1 zf-HC2 domain-containing protein [Accumulibacter sp.]HNC52855.1 zf-HC2 domain-containing protein [Accumulibacter sp.]
MMNCRQAVRLMSEAMDRPLKGGERFALRFHWLICVGCRNYRRQLSFLREACGQEVTTDEPAPPPST